MTARSEIQASLIVIRPARVSDANGLGEMCWFTRSPESIVDLLLRAQKLALNRRGVGAVAVGADDVPCGFGLLTLWHRAAEISDLIVSPWCRGQGIGSMIIGYLTDAAREMRVQTLEIGVALSNPRALALYRRLGFVDGRTIELDLGNSPEPVLYLYKSLK